MKILIVGNGGREHALAWKCAQSPKVTHVFVAPGNAGTALEPNVSNVAISANDLSGLLKFASDEGISLTIVGPEAPLALGIVDAFQMEKLPIFGPTQAATQLESSKAFSKHFMRQYGIPTADYATFSEINEAKNYIKEKKFPLVIKASGLAAGKGVIIAATHDEAITAIEAMMEKDSFGKAGHEIVIEEFLEGEEASFIVMTDGIHILPLASSQDHKRRDEGDKGPNTGGMGAYSPAPIVTAALAQTILDTVIQPAIAGMAEEGIPYLGFLYAGIMIQPDGSIKVLEFNCRLGDPETQPILFRLQSDLVTACHAALNRQLNEIEFKWKEKTALGVVVAAGGYPNAYRKGDVIKGLDQPSDDEYKIFHSGTKRVSDQIVTDGGRVLCVTALGKTVLQAQQKAYAHVKQINWPDVYYRSDIGHRAMATSTEKNS